MAKKFYWLKLKNDFFNQREIKKLRKIAGGDTYAIIYLKLQLLSIKNEGIITFERTEEHIDEQLSLELDEELENIRITLAFLTSNNLIEQITNDDFLLNKVPSMIGSETDSAERVRRLRNKEKEVLALQCNDDVTNSNTEIEKELELELEKEKDIKKDKPFVSKFASDSEPRRLTELLISLMTDNNEFARTPDTPNKLEDWIIEIDRMIRIDGINIELVEGCINWCQNDSFWKSNILSAGKLRKQFPQLYSKAKSSKSNDKSDFVKQVELMEDW